MKFVQVMLLDLKTQKDLLLKKFFQKIELFQINHNQMRFLQLKDQILLKVRILNRFMYNDIQKQKWLDSIFFFLICQENIKFPYQNLKKIIFCLLELNELKKNSSYEIDVHQLQNNAKLNQFKRYAQQNLLKKDCKFFFLQNQKQGTRIHFKKNNFFDFKKPSQIDQLSTCQSSILNLSQNLEPSYHPQDSQIFRQIFKQPLNNVDMQQKDYYRFWGNKNSLCSLIGKNQKLTFNIKTDFEKLKKFENLIQNKTTQKISEQGMIQEMIQPLFGNQSNLIGIGQDTWYLKNNNFSIYNFSQILSKKILDEYIENIQIIRNFYKISSNWQRNTSQKSFFNDNLILSILQNIEAYISFRIIEFQKCTSILKFVKDYKNFLQEIEFVVLFVSNIVQNNNINIIDYFEIVNKNMPKNSFYNTFLMRGFKTATLSSMRIIENVSFKNTSLNVLKNNLGIQYSRDQNLNYITENVPKIYKNLIAQVLILKQNYHFLLNVDEQIYQVCLYTDIKLFKSFKIDHLKNLFEINKKNLLKKKETLNNIILDQLINKRKQKIKQKIVKYKKNITLQIKQNQQCQFDILQSNLKLLREKMNQNYLQYQIYVNSQDYNKDNTIFTQIQNNMMSDNKLQNMEKFFSKQINQKSKEFKNTLRKIKQQKPHMQLLQEEKIILTSLIDQMNYQYESLESNLQQLYDNLENDYSQKIQQIEFEEPIKGDDKLLDVDFDKLPQINNLELFNRLCLNILQYNSQLLDQVVVFIIFENLDIVSHLNAFQKFFFGRNGIITRQLSQYFFSSDGNYKLKSYIKIPMLIKQEIQEKDLQFLKFNMKLKQLIPQKNYNLIQNPLYQFVQLEGFYDHPLNQIFSDALLNFFFQIFSRILQIQKCDQVLCKNWNLLHKLLKNFQHKEIIKIFNSCIRILKQFMCEYQNYIYYFVIERSYKKLIRKMKQSKSFNQIYKCIIEYSQNIYQELFLSQQNQGQYKQINYLLEVIFKINQNLKILEFQEIENIEQAKNTLLKMHQTIELKIRRLLKVIERSRIYKENMYNN